GGGASNPIGEGGPPGYGNGGNEAAASGQGAHRQRLIAVHQQPPRRSLYRRQLVLEVGAVALARQLVGGVGDLQVGVDDLLALGGEVVAGHALHELRRELRDASGAAQGRRVS